MPKKDKARKRKTGQENTRSLVYKDEGQEYAIAGKMLGNGRFKGQCQDGKERLCIIRGNMRNRNWITEGSVVLLSLRQYEDDKADVIHKYGPDEARRLEKEGVLKGLNIKNLTQEDQQMQIQFADADEDANQEIDIDDI